MNANLTDSDMAALDSGVQTRIGLAEVVAGVLELVWRAARVWWQSFN